MKRIGLMALVLAVAPMALPAQGVGPNQDRRAELEQQVRRQFLAQIAERLELTNAQREQVREVLAESADARRDVALESHALRIDLMQAVRSEDASMADFEEILERLDAIRARERQLEEQEEAALADILDPRQRAMFLMVRMQMNERIRQMRGGPGMGRGGPPGDATGGAGPLL